MPDPSLNPVAKHLIPLCCFKTITAITVLLFMAFLILPAVSDFSISRKIFVFLPYPLLARFLLLVGIQEG